MFYTPYNLTRMCCYLLHFLFDSGTKSKWKIVHTQQHHRRTPIVKVVTCFIFFWAYNLRLPTTYLTLADFVFSFPSFPSIHIIIAHSTHGKSHLLEERIWDNICCGYFFIFFCVLRSIKSVKIQVSLKDLFPSSSSFFFFFNTICFMLAWGPQQSSNNLQVCCGTPNFLTGSNLFLPTPHTSHSPFPHKTKNVFHQENFFGAQSPSTHHGIGWKSGNKVRVKRIYWEFR